MIEQPNSTNRMRSKLAQLHSYFDRTATTKIKKNFADIVGYQLGMKSTLDSNLKKHFTSRKRIVKKAVDATTSTLQAQHTPQAIYNDAGIQTTTKQNNTTVSTGSQLYKMRINYILNK